MKQTEILGVDFGGVFTDRMANDDTDTAFNTDNYLMTTATPGIIEVLGRVTRERFSGRVHIISRAGTVTAEKTRHWLEHHDAYTAIGLPPENVHFCRERHDKVGLCARYGITHFIDDRLEVLGHLLNVRHRYLFRPQEKEVSRFYRFYSRVERVNSAEELLALLLPNC